MASNLLLPRPRQILRPKPPRQILEHPSGMSVELLDWMGSDIDIINAARVSLGKESDYEFWRWDPRCECFERQSPKQHYHESPLDTQYTEWYPCLSKTDSGVLNYMMRERHGTPFEMVQLKFRVIAPIGVIWEWVRHRISSFNIMSTRYVEWDKDYYIPESEEWRTQVGKVGHYTFTHIEDPLIREEYVKAMEAAFSYYGWLIDHGLAKEVARNVLPMGSMTQMIWSVNVRSLFNFLSLRTAPTALKEMQICASFVEDLTETVVPMALHLWRCHGKGAP